MAVAAAAESVGIVNHRHERGGGDHADVGRRHQQCDHRLVRTLLLELRHQSSSHEETAVSDRQLARGAYLPVPPSAAVEAPPPISVSISPSLSR